MTVRRMSVTPLDAGIWQPLFDICRQRIRVLGFVDLVADLYLQAVALLFAETQIIAKVLPEIVVFVRHCEVNPFDRNSGAVQGFGLELNGFRADGYAVQHNAGRVSIGSDQDAIF